MRAADPASQPPFRRTRDTQRRKSDQGQRQKTHCRCKARTQHRRLNIAGSPVRGSAPEVEQQGTLGDAVRGVRTVKAGGHLKNPVGGCLCQPQMGGDARRPIAAYNRWRFQPPHHPSRSGQCLRLVPDGPLMQAEPQRQPIRTDPLTQPPAQARYRG